MTRRRARILRPGPARPREGVCAVQNKLAAVIVEAELLRDAGPDALEGLERLVSAAWEASRLLAAVRPAPPARATGQAARAQARQLRPR